MTEEEAKTKWCHAAVASHTDPRATTEYARPELGLPAETFLHACIGSACMAWRVTPVTQRWEQFPDGKMRRLPGQTGLSSGKWVDLLPPERDGYCGLAGAPQ